MLREANRQMSIPMTFAHSVHTEELALYCPCPGMLQIMGRKGSQLPHRLMVLHSSVMTTRPTTVRCQGEERLITDNAQNTFGGIHL